MSNKVNRDRLNACSFVPYCNVIGNLLKADRNSSSQPWRDHPVCHWRLHVGLLRDLLLLLDARKTET